MPVDPHARPPQVNSDDSQYEVGGDKQQQATVNKIPVIEDNDSSRRLSLERVEDSRSQL